MIKGFFIDSDINSTSFIKLSAPSIKSVSRTVNARLARTLQRRILAMSLNASCYRLSMIRASRATMLNEVVQEN